MTMATKVEIFERYKKEYWGAEKSRKGEILDMVSDVTGIHRKAATRKFGRMQTRDPAHEDRRGRKVEYGPGVTSALKDVWEAGNRACGELLFPVIREYVSILTRDRMWSHDLETTEKLLRMSEGTVKRRVGLFLKARRTHHGMTSTSPSALKRIIPIFTGPWEGLPPGHGQVDTVVHRGSSLLGDMVYTVNYTDTATLAVLPRAQWNKGKEATLDNLKEIKKRLFFPLLGLHPDTGSEFVNWFAKDWCDREQIDFSRGRPGKKNDNMYVEERNGHVVRKTVGYIRLDRKEAVLALDEVYNILTPHLFHFVAVRRTDTKERVGSIYRRTYEKKPKTPYERTLAHPAVTEKVKEGLRHEHEKLNPLLMKKEIEKRVRNLYDVQKRYGKSEI